MMVLQHVFAQQCPVAHTTSSPINSCPSGQVKPSQVGTGVVVTVVQGGGSLWQQVSSLHLPVTQAVSLSVLNPLGHVKPSQVGSGVVVMVVMIALQQVCAQHL